MASMLMTQATWCSCRVRSSSSRASFTCAESTGVEFVAARGTVVRVGPKSRCVRTQTAVAHMRPTEMCQAMTFSGPADFITTGEAVIVIGETVSSLPPVRHFSFPTKLFFVWCGTMFGTDPMPEVACHFVASCMRGYLPCMIARRIQLLFGVQPLFAIAGWQLGILQPCQLNPRKLWFHCRAFRHVS